MQNYIGYKQLSVHAYHAHTPCSPWLNIHVTFSRPMAGLLLAIKSSLHYSIAFLDWSHIPVGWRQIFLFHFVAHTREDTNTLDPGAPVLFKLI